ncbi:type II toxin-antitoxin system VapC family toxin [uncultured Enterovirga sp.]|uniref:type II toxin-antitoxin system VapC family toxin n=1 Tax=uncultured Enterovirga sp. TaxID=2026352 RepID=UPI0035CBF25D
MAEAVLDASAVLAFLRGEPGEDVVRRLLPRSLLSTVNLTEIIGKLVERGLSGPEAVRLARELPYEVVSFDAELAASAGSLWARTRGSGLSLGDRACLALAGREKLPAVTTDRRWSAEDTGVRVQQIRPD